MAKSGVKGNNLRVLPSNNHFNGGGNNMNEYATKEELKHVKDLLSEQINHRSDVTDEKINSLGKEIQSNSKVLYWILGIIGTIFTGSLLAILNILLSK